MNLDYQSQVLELPQRFARTLFGSCPLCKSDASEIERIGDCSQHALYRPCFAPKITWLRCLDCRHVYTDGYFEGKALTELLDKVQPDQAPGYNIETQRIHSAEIVERVRGFLSSESCMWLDVGCGSGSLMATAAEFGFFVHGIDLRPYVATALREMGFGVECCELKDLPDPGSYAFEDTARLLPLSRYDVISMADVLEHVPYPQELLSEASKRIKPGGVLFVSCPAADSPVWDLLGEQNPYWGEIEHFHNFSRQRLYGLLREHGLEPMHYGVSKRYRVGMEIVATKTHLSH